MIIVGATGRGRLLGAWLNRVMVGPIGCGGLAKGVVGCGFSMAAGHGKLAGVWRGAGLWSGNRAWWTSRGVLGYGLSWAAGHRSLSAPHPG